MYDVSTAQQIVATMSHMFPLFVLIVGWVIWKVLR